MGQVNELKDFTRGQLDAALMKIGQDAGMGTADGIRAFLSGELVISRPSYSWRGQDGMIYLSVTSDGATGAQWIKRLKKKGFRIGDYAKQVLCSPDFKPTSGVTYEIAVLKGMLFEDNNRITLKIRAEAEKRGWTKPNAEITCLIREKFSDEEMESMGLWRIVVMHEPIKDSDGVPILLGAYRGGDGQWLYACCDNPGGRWDRDYGFAFVASQVGA
ncbi:MAG: hypothetical protein UV34_C0049G0004 [Parcubacteria group bacterium GW2011_GWB1_42_6]|nr:MAG: hypothetical protein UV34_C0049G0004 [Parcubacteria group bacterium GW2011_GWB1_42_6]